MHFMTRPRKPKCHIPGEFSNAGHLRKKVKAVKKYLHLNNVLKPANGNNSRRQNTAQRLVRLLALDLSSKKIGTITIMPILIAPGRNPLEK